MFKQLHHRFVFQRRTKVLSRELFAFIGPGKNDILDIGCGDGTVSKLMVDRNEKITISGIDALARPRCAIPFKLYDGTHIPFDDNHFDVCMFVDVLHHLPCRENIKDLLAEAMRVSGKYILIKDHCYKNSFDYNLLKFMDRTGNKPHGVALEYNYLKENEWEMIFDDLGLITVKKKTTMPLYPFPFSLLFGRKLHFIRLMKISK